MIWVHPEWLWALLLLPLLVLLYMRYNKRHQAKLSLSAYRLLPKRSGWRSYLRALPFALELLALAAIISLATSRAASKRLGFKSSGCILPLRSIARTRSMPCIDRSSQWLESCGRASAKIIAASASSSRAKGKARR